MSLIVAVVKETASGERRVALVPQVVKKLKDAGAEVAVEAGAGTAASYPDSEYVAHGARIVGDRAELLESADVVVCVNAPRALPDGTHEADQLREGSTLISLLFPITHIDTVRRLAERKISAFALELMPRITRAQSMDVLSSMSSIAGYKAALRAADLLPRYFPMLMTAAGTITPARVLVLGAGVAGLQAIATARRLGAVVEAFDIRPVVKEQVESLGARFVDIDTGQTDAQDSGGYAKEQSDETQKRIRDTLARHVAKSDAVITTALIPGKTAPVLVTKDMIAAMRPGSVIVDLAAEQGGNCEGTVAGENVQVDGVTLCGPENLPSGLANHASELFAKNVVAFLLHLIDKGELRFDLEDEITRAPLVTRDGEIVHEDTRKAASQA